MLIEFEIKNNIYDELNEKLYKTNKNKFVIYNFIPVKINNRLFILTCLENLEGFMMDFRHFNAKIYFENKIEIININNVVSFTEKNYNPNQLYDCYIDSVCNLLLVEFKSDKLEYINIDDNLDINSDIKFKCELTKLNYQWYGENLKKKKYEKITNIKYIWDDKYINLPPIPYIIDNLNISNKLIPITGSCVFEHNKLIGMVSYINNFDIVITPIISIKKLSKYLQGEYIFSLCIDICPININIKSEIHKIDYTNGIIIGNDFYDKIFKKKYIKTTKKLINISENNLEESLKENSKDNLDISEKNLEKISKENLEKISKENLEEIFKENLGEISKENLNISEDTLKEISKNTSDEILKETLEEKSKELTENNKYLKMMTILCSIDNYKINSNGYLIISEIKNDENNDNEDKNIKEIPFKSYIWFFKNIDTNKIYLKYIPKHLYKINPLVLNNFKVELTDAEIKKKIEILEKPIILSNFKEISTIDTGELKYIKYKNTYFLELNEKILLIMKKMVCKKIKLYGDLLDKIFSSRYTNLNQKLLLLINFNNNKYPSIKLINNFINFDSVLIEYKTKKEKLDFMKMNH